MTRSIILDPNIELIDLSEYEVTATMLISSLEEVWGRFVGQWFAIKRTGDGRYFVTVYRRRQD